MLNSQIAETFEWIAKLMELHGENSFKTKAYSAAAFTIDKFPQPLAEMNDEALAQVKGFGASIIEQIMELINTGESQYLNTLVQQTPKGVMELLGIKGLGAKKVRKLWKELGIESLGELEYAANENRLINLKGFGAKTQQSILDQIQFKKQQAGKYLWAEAHHIALVIIHTIQQAQPSIQIELVGQVAQQLDVIDKIDFIISDLSLVSTLPIFHINNQSDSLLHTSYEGSISVDFHFSDAQHWRSRQWVLTAHADVWAYVQKKGYLKTTWSSNLIEPPAYLRQTVHWLEEASNTVIPNIIQPTDFKGLIHCHSTYSDGQHSLKDMASHCQQLGLDYMVISDHSQSAFYANGLTHERILTQHKEIDALNTTFNNFKIFKSIECDILFSGALDYPDEVLKGFDLVIASIHSQLKMDKAKATARLITAIEHPATRILGHPTGRLLLARPGYEIDHAKVIDACAANQVVIEINANPKRLDLDVAWVDYALNKGVLLSINPDAHSIDGIQHWYYGMIAAQKSGLQAKHNLSSYTLADFEIWLRASRW